MESQGQERGAVRLKVCWSGNPDLECWSERLLNFRLMVWSRSGFPLGLLLQSFVMFLFFLEIFLIHRDAEFTRLLAVFDAVHPHGMVPPRFAVLLVLDIQPDEIAIQFSEVVRGGLNKAGASGGIGEVRLGFLGGDGRVREQYEGDDEDRAKHQS
jgi:hypothetical protein